MRMLGQNFGSHGQRCKFWQKLHEKKLAKLHTVDQRREDAGPKWKESRLTSEHCAATENSTVGWLTRKRPVNILCFLLHNVAVEWVIQCIANVFFARRLFLALKWPFLKVRKSGNDFFKLTFPPNNEWILLYYYETSGWLVFVCFLEEIEDTKKEEDSMTTL